LIWTNLKTNPSNAWEWEGRFRQGSFVIYMNCIVLLSIVLVWSGFYVALQVLLFTYPGLRNILVACHNPCSAWQCCSYIYCAICFLLCQGTGSQGACARNLIILSAWMLLRRVVIFELLNGGWHNCVGSFLSQFNV
jgi:hypothetical protein